MLVRHTHDQIAQHAQRRPAGYVEQLLRAAVSRDEHGVTFDTDHPAWRELATRHQPRPRPTLRAAQSLAAALLTGRRVPLAVMQARLVCCETCDLLRRDERGQWCGACGCGLSSDARAIRNLAAYEENLPRWGCKHPNRAQGAGWDAVVE